MIKQSEKRIAADTANIRKSIAEIAKAVFKAYIFIIICFIVLALIYTYSNMPDKYLTICIDAVSVLTLFLAGLLSARKIKVMGYLHGAISGFLFSVIRILISLAAFKSYVSSDNAGKIILLGVLISALGGISGVNLGKNIKKRRK